MVPDAFERILYRRDRRELHRGVVHGMPASCRTAPENNDYKNPSAARSRCSNQRRRHVADGGHVDIPVAGASAAGLRQKSGAGELDTSTSPAARVDAGARGSHGYLMSEFVDASCGTASLWWTWPWP